VDFILGWVLGLSVLIYKVFYYFFEVYFVEQLTKKNPAVISELRATEKYNGRSYSMENIYNESFNVNTDLNKNNNKIKYEKLADRSEKDKPWDIHRHDCDLVAKIYSDSFEFEKLFERMEECSGHLQYSEVLNRETGEVGIKLKTARFCRVRHCPVCQWRRSLMWKARFYKKIPDVEQEYKSARWMFLTLTVENCQIEDLRETIKIMNKSFIKMIQRKHFKKYNLGFIKTTEITRAKDGKAHPHFHILLLMNSSYFKYGYLKTNNWAELWGDCLNVNYLPVVDVRMVKAKKGSDKSPISEAVAETLKYAVKPADMIKDPEWFKELTRQVHKLRFVSTGGILKDLFKEDVSEEDLLLLTEEEETDKELRILNYNWFKNEKNYKRKLAD